MNKLLMAFLTLCFAFSVQAHESNDEFDQNGNSPQKIEHRLSDLYQTYGKNLPVKTVPTAGSTSSNSSPIRFHGGPVMSQVSAIYIIWYGDWSTNKDPSNNGNAKTILRNAVYGLANHPSTLTGDYSGITRGASSPLGCFNQSTSTTCSTATVSVKDVSSKNIYETTDASSQGTSFGDAGVLAIVNKAIAAKNWTSLTTNTAASTSTDPNAIYLVLTSSDINETSGFLTQYCGWHNYSSSTNLKYAFIGNPNRNLAACTAQSVSPNNNPAVDGMVSVIAHELIETVTDPQLNAWYNGRGYENGDMCAWTFGANLSSSSGAYYNVTLPNISPGNSNYLIQRAPAPANSKCYVDANGKQ